MPRNPAQMVLFCALCVLSTARCVAAAPNGGSAADGPVLTGGLTIEKFFDCYQDALPNGEDKMLPGEELSISGPHGYIATSVTDADGRIILAGLIPGEYSISQTLPDDQIATTGEPVLANVVAGSSVTAFVGNCLPGDINQDGLVDTQDFTTLKANMGQSVGLWTWGDITGGPECFGDGLIDSQDFSLLKAWFGRGEVPAAVVPEPASAALLAVAATAVFGRRRKSSRPA